MILLNPFNCSPDPLFEVHITIREDAAVLETLNSIAMLPILGIKLTPILFFNNKIPSQYMLTYTDRTEDLYPRLNNILSDLRSVGCEIIRIKVETTYGYFRTTDDLNFLYYETHIELPMDCFHKFPASPSLLKSYNGKRPHNFSLTNRSTSSDMGAYYLRLGNILDNVESLVLPSRTYRQREQDHINIEVCILDTNTNLDIPWLQHLE